MQRGHKFELGGISPFSFPKTTIKMILTFFITTILIAAGLLMFGYYKKESAAIMISGIILLLAGLSTIASNVEYVSGTNTTAFTENIYEPYEYNETSTAANTTKTTMLLMNSTTTTTEADLYSKSSGIADKVFGVILLLVGLYFVFEAAVEGRAV